MKHQDALLRHRWLYVAQNLQVTENVPKVIELLRRAKAAGYNGLVLADYKLNILDRVPDHYFKNAAAVKQAATELGLGLYPTVCSGGYDSGLLAHDPNLAEGLPVKDAVFLVKGKTAALESAGVNLLPGGALDEARNGNFSGWDFNDAAALDTNVKKSGAAALRFTATSGNLRVSKRLALPPFRQYHLSVWIKTEGFKSAGDIHCTVLPGGAKPSLCHSNAGVKPTQDWTQHHFVFNTLDSASVGVYLGCWGAAGGTLWLDDVRLEEVGLLNVVRRAGCPLTVRSDDGTVYTEGRDFEKIVDPRMGNVPWPGEFEVWHAPPSIAIPVGSRIKDGQRLRVSYYHAITIYDGQVSASLVDPAVFALHKDQLQRVQKLLTPRGFFLSHDELRTAGWSADAQATGKTPGALLAANVKTCIAYARQTAPRAELVAWSDMFDPFHNAVDNYYLVRGSLAGSWEGLSKDVQIMNWNSGKAKESLDFFAKRGHSQILAGYYDSNPSAIKGWLGTAKALGGARVTGVMYTTWAHNYSQLEAFAKAAWG